MPRTRMPALLAPCLFLAAQFACAADLPVIPPRTVRDITAMLDDYKPEPEKVERVRALLLQAPPAAKDPFDVARFYVGRARAAQEVGAVRQAIADYRSAVENGGGEEPARTLRELAFQQRGAGNFREAIETLKKAIATTPQNMWGTQVGNYASLARFQIELGDMAAAKQSLELSQATLNDLQRSKNWGWFNSGWRSSLEMGRAEYSLAQGHYAEAEAALLHSIELLDKQLSLNPTIAKLGLSNAPDVQLHGGRIMAMGRVAMVQLLQGKYLDAEMRLRDALKVSLSQFGRDSPQTAALTFQFARFLNETGRYREAEAMSRAALATWQGIGAAPESSGLANARAALADSLVNQGRWREAIDVYQEMMAPLSADPDLQKRHAHGSAEWATALLRVGRPGDAAAMLQPLHERSQRWLGAGHYRTAELGGLLGTARWQAGAPDEALAAFGASIPALLAASNDEDQSPARSQRLKIILEGYVGLLAEIRGTPLEKKLGVDAAAEAFRLADAVRGQGTQQAVAASAARSAAGTPALAALIRKEQDLRQEAESLRRILADLMSAPPEQRLPKVIADMQGRIGTIANERKATRADIEKGFPAYHELINPKPATIEQARAALAPGEALVSILSAADGTYVWAFRREGPVAFVPVRLAREDLARMVQKLRLSLDPGPVDIASRLPAFDLDVAHRLYAELLAPVAAGWQGADSLLVAANGALTQLPFGVLATAKADLKSDPKLRYAQYKDAPWLIRQVAITELPSVNALVTLRRLTAGAADRSVFIGFGDPQFALAAAPAPAGGTRKLRNLAIDRVSQQAAPEAKPVDWIDYGRIPPLPDTREEILAIAAALGADRQKDVFLGAQASKANLQRLDLAKRRIVAFATHGLLPGDFPGVSEPSLALANPGDGHHGLLTLEEILGLKLDADWVVLSACNTAAGDGAGADAISGLGRGFFYAGTRALLATHWPVESVSARLLVTGIFERQKANPALSRAQALRQSMLALMAQRSDAFAYAHPLFWAPYSLIGDGGAEASLR
ncbi:MAG: CHAT domain-containing protein [Ignavibacteria bacterium]